METYIPTLFFKNGHANTIVPALFRKVDFEYTRERVELEDGDFLDLDWHVKGNKKLAIVLHGLESETQVSYMKGMCKYLSENNFDTVAINFRGCSGEQNRLFKAYHSGFTEDLREVFNFIETQKDYDCFYLVGFSMGGNILLKYLGEEGDKINQKIKKAVAISTPCDLAAVVKHLAKRKNQLYEKRFIRSLKVKLLEKSEKFPDLLTRQKVISMRHFYDIDEIFTAPTHGFLSAEDYWEKNSSIKFIEKIALPTLILSASDDPFLTQECFPIEESKNNPFIKLHISKYGGHVGFIESFKNNKFFHERATFQFFMQ